MKFRIEIDLGNDAMQTVGDVRRALMQVYNRLNMLPSLAFMADELDRYDSHVQIRDDNGNTVGFCEVVR